MRTFLKKVVAGEVEAPPLPMKKGGSGTTDTMFANGGATNDLLGGYTLPLKDAEAATLNFNVAEAGVTWQAIFQHSGGQLPSQVSAGVTLEAIEGAAAEPAAA